jgi:hypothetical protein
MWPDFLDSRPPGLYLRQPQVVALAAHFHQPPLLNSSRLTYRFSIVTAGNATSLSIAALVEKGQRVIVIDTVPAFDICTPALRHRWAVALVARNESFDKHLPLLIEAQFTLGVVV